MCFFDKPKKANHTVDQDLYASITEGNFSSDFVVTVRGNKVCFDFMRIINYYGIPDVNNDIHMKRAREAGQEWFMRHLHGGHMPKWIDNK